MLHLDISGAMAKLITPAMGLTAQEIADLRTPMRKNIESWLKERSNGEHAWSMDPYQKKTVEAVKTVAMKYKGEGIKTVLWIGIGGSSLGPQVLSEVFGAQSPVKFIVLDSIDPAMLTTALQGVDWKAALVVCASKSGDTLEPMSIFFYCLDKLRKSLGKKAFTRVIAVTDPEKGNLRRFAREYAITTLDIPPDVGGRYCIFTPVGLLPLALMGVELDRFVRGAKDMDTLCQKTSLEENPAAHLAAVQFLMDTKKNYPVRVIMSYSGRLRSMGRWNQQLIAESLGKTESKNPIPLAAVGTQDQHSLLQQWMEGPRKQWHLFIRELEKDDVFVPKDVDESWAFISQKSFGDLLDAAFEGTSRGLTKAKRPWASIALTRLDPYHLGQLFFLLLAEVVLLGKLYRIDPYGQPGVEIGKKITREILSV
jgi:glucose-6-phosphate isomerase